MTDSPRLTPATGTLSVQGSPRALIVGRAAETWQFFAFVFAAAVTLVLALIDEMPDRLAAWRIAAKVVAFGGLAYLTLVNIRVRNWLARLLGRFKEERR